MPNSPGADPSGGGRHGAQTVGARTVNAAGPVGVSWSPSSNGGGVLTLRLWFGPSRA